MCSTGFVTDNCVGVCFNSLQRPCTGPPAQALRLPAASWYASYRQRALVTGQYHVWRVVTKILNLCREIDHSREKLGERRELPVGVPNIIQIASAPTKIHSNSLAMVINPFHPPSICTCANNSGRSRCDRPKTSTA